MFFIHFAKVEPQQRSSEAIMTIRQYCATTYIIHENKILFIHHRKYNKWQPPGGHIDPNEIPEVAARREVLEETGLVVELYTQENLVIDRPNAKSMVRPYICLLEQIPAHGDHPAHEHMDLIFLAKPLTTTIDVNLAETHDARWFTLAEIEALESDQDIYDEVKQIARHLLTCEQMSFKSEEIYA